MPKDTLKKRISTAFGQIKENVVKSARIEINGKRELVVSGCKNINAYDARYAEFATKSMDIKIKGDGLELMLLAGDTIAVRGKIDNVELVNKK